MPALDVAPESFDGTKTINLLPIMSSLKESQYRSAPPALLHLSFVIYEKGFELPDNKTD